MKKRVFVIESELISPISVGVDKLMHNIMIDTCADRKLTKLPVDGIPFKKAAEVQEDLFPLYAKEPKVVQSACAHDRKLELLAAAYGKAEDRLQPILKALDPKLSGVILGVGADVTPFELFEDQMVEYLRDDCNPIVELYSHVNDNHSRINLTNNSYDLYSIYLAQKFNAEAFQKSVLTACVSSTQALALAYDSIANGEAELVVAGGTDSLINMLAIISFGKLGVIAESSEDPSCRPFDLNRKGTLAGEAAGFAILVNEEFLSRTGIRPIAEILGYGNTLDAYKITSPDPEGSSMVRAIKLAMKSAGLKTSQIDYINAHGTGTRQNDHLELKSFLTAMGEDLKKVPISSTKDRHGHAIAAAGIQEFCVMLETMKHGQLPSNLNLKNPCEESFNLLRENKKANVSYGLTSNFAFGGINTVLALKNSNL